MTAAELSAALKPRVLALGFEAVGVTTLEPNAHGAELDQWLDRGYAGTMRYLHRQAAMRREPQRILPNAKAAVVTLTNYCHGSPPERGPRVAQYAWSDDYHAILQGRLDQVAAIIAELVPGARSRAFVDAGPVPERELAQRAGLGWIGKNTMLIHPRLGSFTFIGVVLTDAALALDLPFEADRCGSCRRCLDACPTDAFPGARVMDARRCISYLTIEHRGRFADAEARMVGNWLFGCDVCQDVCPWNVTFARPTVDRAFAPCPDRMAPVAEVFLEPETQDFDRRFGTTPFARPGAEGMRRNAAAVLANLDSPRLTGSEKPQVLGP